MKTATKRICVLTLCIAMFIMSAIPTFASQYEYTENHNIIDCANRYVEGSCYNFLIKIPEELSTDNVTIQVHNQNGYIHRITNLSHLASLDYASMHIDNNHSGHNYYLLTLDASHPSFPDNMRNKMGIKLRCTYRGRGYMATDNANGSFTVGPGYYLSIN